MKNLIIIGVGGIGRQIYCLAKDSIGYMKDWQLKGYLDGDVLLDKAAYDLLQLPLLGNIANYKIQENDVFVCAMAEPKVKKKIVQYMQKSQAAFTNIIHNTAIIAPTARLGKGIICCPYTLIDTDAVIGDFVMLNYYTSIGHDVVMGDYVSLMGHVDITGNVKVGDLAYFGSGSRVLPKACIGENAVIGAGSVVLKYAEANQVLAGVPAKVIK